MTNRMLAVLILSIHSALQIVSSYLQFPTRNEVAHVPAGVVCWQMDKCTLYKVDPPLWRMIATLPTWLLRPKLDGVHAPSWPGDRPEWTNADVFAADNAANYFALIWSA